MNTILLYIVFLVILLILFDFFKRPIDILYFNNPYRVLYGIKNSLIDLVFYKKYYNVSDYKNLDVLHLNYNKIKNEFIELHNHLPKKYFHDKDKWFENNNRYFYYEGKHFPYLKSLIETIPSTKIDNVLFSVMIDEYNLPIHKAESNDKLRYQLTILNTSRNNHSSWLETEYGKYYHKEGDHILFDHSRAHAAFKLDKGMRVVLIINVNRFETVKCGNLPILFFI